MTIWGSPFRETVKCWRGSGGGWFYLGGNEMVTFFQQFKKLIYYPIACAMIPNPCVVESALTSHMHLMKDSIKLPVVRSMKWKKLAQAFVASSSRVVWQNLWSQILRVLVAEGTLLNHLGFLHSMLDYLFWIPAPHDRPLAHGSYLLYSI